MTTMRHRERRVNASSQLALPVTLADHARFDNFHADGNETVVAALLAPSLAPAVWLYGTSGVGKSHLLQALCHTDKRCVYLTSAMLLQMPPAALEGFERYARVCIDDVHALLGDREREIALFHLYNRLLDAQGALVFSADRSARNLTFVLPDLASRLRAAVALQVHELDDEGRLAVLEKRADARGFELPSATGRYLLNHYRRDMKSLCAMLDTLDLASLAAHRPLTIPFVKTIL